MIVTLNVFHFISRQNEDQNSHSTVRFDLVKELQKELRISQRAGLQFNHLVTGDTGTGKTTFLRQMKLAMESQNYVYTHIISCKQLIGKIQLVFEECLYFGYCNVSLSYTGTVLLK